MRTLTIGTLNSLAERYTDGKYGSYAHVDPQLLLPGARNGLWPKIIRSMGVDILGMQEVEESLVELLESEWQTRWSPKKNSHDGCLLLVRRGIEISDFRHHYFGDGTGYVAQTWRIGDVQFGNAHLRFHNPARLAQVTELLSWMGKGPAVLMGDFNDWPRPNGPVLGEVTGAKFHNIWGNASTALVNGEAEPLDVLAVRDVEAEPHVIFGQTVSIQTIPTWEWPSDHYALSARISLP